MEEDKSRTGQRLMEAVNQFHKLKRSQGSLPGLKHTEMMLLHCVKFNTEPGGPGIKVSEISNILRVTSPSITQLVKSLEHNGYVERNADNEDRRAVRIKLSEKGEGVLAKVSEVLLASFTGLAEYMGEQKSDQFIELLTEAYGYFAEQHKASV